MKNKIEELKAEIKELKEITSSFPDVEALGNIYEVIFENKGKIEGIEEAQENFLKVIEKVIFEARKGSFYRGIGYWSETEDVEGIMSGLLELEQELKKEVMK